MDAGVKRNPLRFANSYTWDFGILKQIIAGNEAIIWKKMGGSMGKCVSVHRGGACSPNAERTLFLLIIILPIKAK